jgi:hypothetical protein
MLRVNPRGRALVVLAATGLAWGMLSLAGQASAQEAVPSTTCTAPVLTGFKVPALVYVGGKLAVKVTLSCAPASPVAVSLTSDNTYLPVPGALTVGSGHTSATADLTPGADDAGQYQATLTAQYGATSLPETVTVDPGLSSLSIPACGGEPDCVDPEVLFTGPAPAGGLTVQFTSNNPAVTVPASSTFQEGVVGGGIIGDVSPVTANTPITIKATLGGYTLHVTKVLLPPFGQGDHVMLSPESGQTKYIYGQEFNLEYQAGLSNPAGSEGVTVTFSSPSPSLELQQTSDYIPPGFTDGFTDVNTADVTAPVHTTLTATADGISKTIPVIIEPGLDSFSGLPAAIKGGRSFTATINLAGPVDTRTAIDLDSTDGVLTVPTVVHVAPGQSSVSFKVTTVPVTSKTGVSIVAMLGSSTLQSNTITLTK